MLYIKVGNGWWIKPTYAQPLTDINCDGTWRVLTVTGGTDFNATEFFVYLVPVGYNPPTVYDAADLQANSVASKSVVRQ